MKQRIATNNLTDENTKLRTRLQMVENELTRKDRIIDDLIAQADSSGKLGGRGGSGMVSHLVTNLKRKVKDQQAEMNQKKEEVELLKRNIKNTRTHETEIEIKLFMEECARLRQKLEEVIKSKDTFADPQELKIIEQKFQQRDLVISQIQEDNNQALNTLKIKDEENRQLAQLVQEMERRMKKAQSLGKSG